MASINLIKQYKSLQLSKFRQKYDQFIIEGLKSVRELLESDYEIVHILGTTEYESEFGANIKWLKISKAESEIVSSFKTAPGIAAIAFKKHYTESNLNYENKVTLVLDGISDPGNFGTLIRTANWFGISQIIVSKDCVDLYNPKVISSTMGSFTRVKVIEMELSTFLKDKNTYGAELSGYSLNHVKINFPLFLVIGSESNGISKPVSKILKESIRIEGNGTESLNAAVAGGILMHALFEDLK